MPWNGVSTFSFQGLSVMDMVYRKSVQEYTAIALSMVYEDLPSTQNYYVAIHYGTIYLVLPQRIQ